MLYRKLGSSELDVSHVCLGTMTWGMQNSQAEANEQIEYALASGINFFDTAEMYPVPPSPENYGKTEQFFGNWLKANPEKRKDMIIATKIAGNGLPWVRDAEDITGESIIRSVDASLKRLQTDYIDLYQLHWTNRISPHFGKHWPGIVDFTVEDSQQHIDGMLQILQALDDCIKAGKIRFCGLSDDTTWGISQYLRLAEKHALPRMVSIQNEFNLLHWKDWPYLIEHCVHENVAYLPWSPLGGGMLSGKYLNGARPEGTRWSISQRMGLFRDTEHSREAVQAYLALAQELNRSSVELALAWCSQVKGVTSTIIGATSLAQLKEDIGAFEKPLSSLELEKVGEIMRQYPMSF